ncbi:MAG: hypothetical protein ACKOSO_05180 [Actinomycetota bacterium]
MATPTTELAPGTGDPDRPFTDPAHADADVAMLERLQAILAAHATDGGRDGRWTDPDGARHWLVVPDWAALAAARPAVGVGFFGQALDVDHEPINRVEAEMLERPGRYPGLLAYYNVEFPQGDGTSQWGNLVVFADRASREHLGAEGLPRTAVDRSPLHYDSLRLHRIVLPDGALGRAAPVLDESLLFDFRSDPTWIALRRPRTG